MRQWLMARPCQQRLAAPGAECVQVQQAGMQGKVMCALCAPLPYTAMSGPPMCVSLVHRCVSAGPAQVLPVSGLHETLEHQVDWCFSKLYNRTCPADTMSRAVGSTTSIWCGDLVPDQLGSFQLGQHYLVQPVSVTDTWTMSTQKDQLIRSVVWCQLPPLVRRPYSGLRSAEACTGLMYKVQCNMCSTWQACRTEHTL